MKFATVIVLAASFLMQLPSVVIAEDDYYNYDYEYSGDDDDFRDVHTTYDDGYRQYDDDQEVAPVVEDSEIHRSKISSESEVSASEDVYDTEDIPPVSYNRSLVTESKEITQGVGSYSKDNITSSSGLHVRQGGTRDSPYDDINDHTPGDSGFTFSESGASTDDPHHKAMLTEQLRSDILPTAVTNIVEDLVRNGVDNGDTNRDYNIHFEHQEDAYDSRNFYRDVLDEAEIILVNNPIDVPYGRVRYLDSENDLKIKVEKGHRCHITVLDNEPVIQRPGKLVPSNFSCQFTLNEVQYTHLGARYPSEDMVKLLLRYDTQHETFMIPLTLSVKVQYSMQLEVVTENMPLTVKQLLGTSEMVDRSNTQFAFDESRHECKITLLHRFSDLPRYGVVISDTGNTPTDYMVPCLEFLDSGIRYQHTVETSTQIDYIPAVVELYDSHTMTLLKQEYFQFLIRIQEGNENTIPSVLYESLLLLDVNQFVMAALTPAVVTVTDAETPNDQLIYNVTKPLRYGEGILVSTDDQHAPLSSFYQQDMKDLKIAYKPPTEDSDVERRFDIEFEVIDAEGLASKPFTLVVVVNPKMTWSPVVTKNKGLELFEGQSRYISTSQNLEIADEDNLEDVTLSVVDGLKHGRLLLMGAPTLVFSPADLDAGAVIYEHDGSDTYSDNMLLSMSDNENTVNFLFPITIYPEDDEPPVVHVNTGLQVDEGEELQITPFLLSATDVDSDDSHITFLMQEPYIKLGVMILRSPSFPVEPGNWQFINGVYEKLADTWTQKDITDGFLYYRHLGEHSITPVTEKVYFTLIDMNDPPNQSSLNEIHIQVLSMDNIPPIIHSECSLSLTVSERQLTALTNRNLLYTDLDTKEKYITYDIQPLYNVDASASLPTGDIVLTDSPDMVVDRFTQAQVNHQKISYLPPNQELGIVPRIIQFKFLVIDSKGNSLNDQTFTIFLKPVNNQPPEVRNKGSLKVEEHGEAIITTEYLDVSDNDTEVGELIFRVTKLPNYGDLIYNTMNLATGNQFSRQDLISHHIRYRNNGQAEMEIDSFQVEVTDGVHNIPITVFLAIQPIDDETPKLLERFPGDFGATIEVFESQEANISPRILKATDPDSELIHLTFIVQEAPIHGKILLNGIQTSSFTQMSIERGEVVYQHYGGEIGNEAIQDRFTLTLSDMSDEFVYGGNRVEEIVVNITIKPVDNIPPHVSITADLIVSESLKTSITGNHITVTDGDSSDERLNCIIIQQPLNGYVENTSPAPGHETSRRGIPITLFSLFDISNGNVNYVQSIFTKVEPREDFFIFYCSDGINKSPDKKLNIVIEPFNDEKPELLYKEFVVMEGMDLIIKPPILLAIDNDIPDDQLTFRVSRSPQHGKIVKHGSTGMQTIHEFTMEELSYDSMIIYSHDDSETIEDVFELELTDGKPTHTIKKEIMIKILPQDDEAPRLTINTGIEVNINASVSITNKELKAEDLDSNNEGLIFAIRKAPRFGHLQLKRSHGTLEILASGMNFTQQDLKKERINYVHNSIPGVRDLFKFDLTDGTNSNMDQSFYIDIIAEDHIFPDVVSKGVQLPEGGRVVLTTDILRTSDLNSPDELLNFTVTRSPSKGHLEISDDLGLPVTTFTQLQLAGNKVSYIHSIQDENKMDSFEFVVTDGRNAVFRTFRISITDVDNKRPVLFLNTLKVQEGGSSLITPFEVQLEDRDTDVGSLKFTITKMPSHGRLLFDKTQTVQQFTQLDLEKNRVSYHHDGSETLQDLISFLVTDGTHRDFYVYPNTDRLTHKEQTLSIVIDPIDDSVPIMFLNRRATYLSLLDEGSESLGLIFSSRFLEVRDEDSIPEDLTYRIDELPTRGHIVKGHEWNDTTEYFTQADINERSVAYRLNDGENATTDSFRFTVVDKAGNQMEQETFRLDWSWISLEKQNYVINETEKELLVRLRRRGYLGETSFVSMVLQNGTAIVGEDVLSSYAFQVQFNPGRKSALWRLRLVDDLYFEGIEFLSISLRHSVMASLEYPVDAIVSIQDEEDMSVVEFESLEYKVEEDVGELKIGLLRRGDNSKDLHVRCLTQSGGLQGEATGTAPTSVLSYSDYISRPDDKSSMIRFGAGKNHSECHIVVIDDSLYEEAESFSVTLASVRGGRIGNTNTTVVTVLPDVRDEPTISFKESHYLTDETDGSIKVTIQRSGTDLSRVASVQVASKATKPKQAQAGMDYVAVGRQVDFSAGEMTKVVTLTILDDLGHPKLEGEESLLLVLQVPTNASLGKPNTATVVISDSLTDLPRFNFVSTEYSGYEEDCEVMAWVIRTGDTSHAASVRCYTRQATAQATLDFDERPDTNVSLLHFKPGESEQPCKIILVNDHVHEPYENLTLVLGSASSASAGGALLGSRKTANIIIKDKADKPTLQFEHPRLTIEEPQGPEEQKMLKVGLIRGGDLTPEVMVRVHTKDGSATSGEDYYGVSKDLVFTPNVSRLEVEVAVIGDSHKETRESFTIHLKAVERSPSKVHITGSKVIVYIEEMTITADVTFPSRPVVTSLRDYDLTHLAADPIPGYPVICVTACDSRHPDYSKTRAICHRQGINDSLSTFRWQVAGLSGLNGGIEELRDVTSDTFFTRTNRRTLDSIYFSAGSKIRCLARAFSTSGDAGIELRSIPITVSQNGGLCPPRTQGTFGAEPFTAKLRYTGRDGSSHPNLVRVEVTLPHRDGLIPVISTRKPGHFDLILSRDGLRIGNHRCSNLIDFHEVRTFHGFVSNGTSRGDLKVMTETEPYQYSSPLRGDATLRFYRSLDIESCMWRWVSHYTLSELISQCGGSIISDGQVLNAVQSYVSLDVPLYVSYVYHSSATSTKWRHTDLKTQLRLTFVYDTTILWHQGVGALDSSPLEGLLYPTAMMIRQDGRLAVDFKSEAKFRGTFLESHSASDMKSRVTSDDHPDMTFSLTLIRSQPTFEGPEQRWQFVSDFAIRDYSGLYIIHLLPCTVTEDVTYSTPLICNPRKPVAFDLQVRFQQVSDPVAERFSLNTQFHLTRKRELWLSSNVLDFDTSTDMDVAFFPGDRIYGRIMIDPVQAIGDEFHLTLEKCFICTGVEGYVPKYDPEADEYGCVVDSPSLLHNFKIIDREVPNSSVIEDHSIGFNARLAEDDPETDVIDLLSQPGSDGFSLDSMPLFRVGQGKQWFIHCIYTVRAREGAKRGIVKRDINSFGATEENNKVIYRGVSGSVGIPGTETSSWMNVPTGSIFHNSWQSQIKLPKDIDVEEDFLQRHRRNPSEAKIDQKSEKEQEITSIDHEVQGTNMHRLSLRLNSPGHGFKPEVSQVPSSYLQPPLIIVLAGLCVLLSTLATTIIFFIYRKRRKERPKIKHPGYMPVAVTSHQRHPKRYHKSNVCTDTREESTEV